MLSLLDPTLRKTAEKDRAFLEATQLPIVTVSASYKEDVKGMFGFPEDETLEDVVFSRAHYSMAVGILIQAWQGEMKPELAWAVDPTNYVSHQNWKSIELTENIGKLLARRPFLKRLKDFVDQFGRNKLPILKSITPPLLYMTHQVKRPILSLHIAAGNILLDHGQRVVQVITDPHVREEYLNHADSQRLTYCVFDDKTKTEVIEKATILGKKIDSKRVVVTGPPVDPRITGLRKRKPAWRSGPLKLCITTGGLGTNKTEIRRILRQLIPQLRRRPHPYQLLVYTGTHADINLMVHQIAEEEHIAIGSLNDIKAKLRIIHHPQIVDANELLIAYGFPWADGFITKPSGDMAYDAAASGSFMLTLNEWGEWEHNIREVFEQLGVARQAETDHIVAQLEALTATQHQAQSWVETAMNRAQQLDKLFLTGAENIITAYNQAAQKKSPAKRKNK